MKSWLQNRKLRKQRSALPARRRGFIEVDEIISPIRPSLTTPKQRGVVPYAAANLSYRMSMERYLNAPLSDEPASAPAIDAALKKRQTLNPSATCDTGAAQMHHSRDTSAGANSEGQRTFFTSGSIPDNKDTCYTTKLEADQQLSVAHHDTTMLTTLERPDSQIPEAKSPERLITSGTVREVDMSRDWAELVERYMPAYSPDEKFDYRAKAEEETARVQKKAQRFERSLRRYDAGRDSLDTAASIVTDEMPYACMAVHPKLIWMLGGASTKVKAIDGPTSEASIMHELPNRQGTASRADLPQGKLPRRSNSGRTSDGPTTQLAVGRHPTRLMGQTQTKRPKFYCTFCEQRFHDRVGWMMHEQVIHLPEELWICCPRIGEFPKRCPFCEKRKPSPSHLADHSYLLCQEKPLSERTFRRKDLFLQHISQVHQARIPARLVELLEAWRRPLPLEEGHKALHCGFCGSTFTSYPERTQHVNQHFTEGLDMMSWWDDRISHNAQPRVQDGFVPTVNLPHKCVYCERTFENIGIAQQIHPSCSMWSCSFLPSMTHTIYLVGMDSTEAACCFCNDTLACRQGKVKKAMLKDHLVQHNFRKCDQRLYFSSQRFRQHLQDSHRTTFDGTLFAGWTLLLKSSRKDKPAIFQQATPSATRRMNTVPNSALEHVSKTSKNHNAPPNFMDLTVTPQGAGPAKLRRKTLTQTIHGQPAQHIRESTQFFAGPATLNPSHGPIPSPPPQFGSIGRTSLGPKSRDAVASMAERVVSPCPIFYRKTVDASTRNRLYFYEGDQLLSKTSQHLFRQIPYSVLGGLILHSSLIGAVAVRMTNSVDIYSLH